MFSDDDNLDSESDIPSMTVPVRRPVIIPESDDDSSEGDKSTLSIMFNENLH